ncbi:MAG: metalloregulator ArsR/SmtB family transcription factor [Bacteroidetes bacterium]|nr:metalloregulator ArsR/SmtB family transcription factor [Bacteroidota bacterium]MDA1268716.1 metalloregulator ArsR/SmtB family transcription factor [Bacteroidota bacterium]
MGRSKTALFTPSQNELADLARALAHPARVAILQYLANSQSCINGTLVQELSLAQSTISQHLQELKELGLIRGTIDGASVNYCLDIPRWREVQQYFQAFFEQISEIKTGDLCCD